MRRTLLISVPLIALLAACATRPASTGPSPSPPAPLPAAAPRPTLASEQLRLSELFRGTPVAFALQQDGSLRATVPRRYCFDPGAAKVKPPLAAVLDRLAKSQRHAVSRMRVNTPSDPEVRGTSLSRERALSARDYLMGQGIVATRVQASGGAQVEQVEIVIVDAAP